MIDISQHYNDLGQKCNEILQESLNSKWINLISENHSVIFDYNNSFIELLKERPEYYIYTSAIREYQLSLLCINLGLYNQAYASLRFFFERTLFGVFFSAKELELRLWLNGERDIYWSEITDENNGVFSYKFCNAFFPEMKDESLHYLKMAQKVYRECSEYVHGNYTTQNKLSICLEFNHLIFEEWHSHASTIKKILFFLFCLRYIRFIGNDQLKSIEAIILEEVGHLPAIMNYLTE